MIYGVRADFPTVIILQLVNLVPAHIGFISIGSAGIRRSSHLHATCYNVVCASNPIFSQCWGRLGQSTGIAVVKSKRYSAGGDARLYGGTSSYRQKNAKNGKGQA